MGESSQPIRLASKTSEEHLCKFGTVVRALWPEKSALNLAQRVGCTERAASFYINGERKPSLDALLAILDEMRERD